MRHETKAEKALQESLSLFRQFIRALSPEEKNLLSKTYPINILQSKIAF